MIQQKHVLGRGALALAVVLAMQLAGCRSARPAADGELVEWGVPVFPGAEPQPAVAAAVKSYYAPSLPSAGFEVGVFETEADFETVYGFYGPRMEPGKWGWRRKSRPLEHQTRTLAFLRQQWAGDRRSGGVPAGLEPLLGDRDWSDADFQARLAELAERGDGTVVEIVEGVRAIPGDPRQSRVRVIVERPYVDLAEMALVDRTRIQLLKIPRSE